MTSLIARIEQRAAARPDAVAVIDGARRLTYGELWREASAIAAGLHRRGIRAGDTVALSLEEREATWMPSLVAFYALGYLGAVVLPLHPEAPAASRAALAMRFKARWHLASGPAPRIEGAEPVDLEALESSDVGGGTAPRGDAPERPFLYMFTSGTTGNPKICLFPFGQLTAHRLQYCAEIGTTAGDCLAAALPWPSKVGLRFMLRMHAIGGTFCNQVLPESLDALGGMIRQHGLTQLIVSPWQLRRLLQQGTLDPRAPPLRVLQIGGGFLAPQELAAARERITPNVYAVYAATELGVLAHLPPGVPPGAPGHVGRLVPAVQGQSVEGALRFRTPSMPRSYVDNPEATAKCFRDGWFYPGDLGEIDAEGNVTLHGRADEVINYGGTKIEPDAAEILLARHPDIADVALVGVPHAMAGEVPVAFAVFRRMPSAQELQRFCAEHLDRSRMPLEFVHVDRIPRNREGKVLRGELRAAYSAAQRGRAPAA